MVDPIGHLSKVRQALKIMTSEKEPLRLTDETKTFADYAVKEDSHIILRDMGAQIGYRDVELSPSVHFRCSS